MNRMARAAVGYAADDTGNGVAYVRIDDGALMLRVGFHVQRYAALLDREVGYAALGAVSRALLRRGIERVEFAIDEEPLRKDLCEHRDVPAALTLLYVRLRCVLNQFAAYAFAPMSSGDADLMARARSDVAMHAAA